MQLSLYCSNAAMTILVSIKGLDDETCYSTFVQVPKMLSTFAMLLCIHNQYGPSLFSTSIYNKYAKSSWGHKICLYKPFSGDNQSSDEEKGNMKRKYETLV